MISRDSGATAPNTQPGSLPPIAQAVFDSLPEGVLVFDADGRFLFANEPARRAVGGIADPSVRSDPSLRARLSALGAKVTPLRSGHVGLGEAVILPSEGSRTLAERERQAILDTLRTVNGKLAETARRLGISRTTLRRRLKTYGIERHARV